MEEILKDARLVQCDPEPKVRIADRTEPLEQFQVTIGFQTQEKAEEFVAAMLAR